MKLSAYDAYSVVVKGISPDVVDSVLPYSVRSIGKKAAEVFVTSCATKEKAKEAVRKRLMDHMARRDR